MQLVQLEEVWLDDDWYWPLLHDTHEPPDTLWPLEHDVGGGGLGLQSCTSRHFRAECLLYVVDPSQHSWQTPLTFVMQKNRDSSHTEPEHGSS